HLLGLLLLLELVEAGLQDLHRHRLVLVLRALVLAGDDDPGGEMREAHGGVGLVDVLSAGTARPVRIDAEVLVADLDLDLLLDVGKHEDRRERRLPPGIRVERRDADQAVDAGLGLRIAVRIRALDGERRALDARAFAGLLLEELGPEPAPLAPAEVHAEEHLGPVLRLEPAGAGMNLDDRVAGVVLAAEELPELELREAGFDLLDLRAELVQRVRIAFLGELEEDLRLVDALALAAPPVDGVPDAGRLAADGLRLLGVLPEVGRRRLRAQVGGATLQRGEVKDAS